MASSHAELQSVQEELTALVAAITIVQGRLTDVMRRSLDEARSVQERMEELERDGEAMTRELQDIWAFNQELQDAAANRANPAETEKAVDARNAAIRKLHRARKVIHDLMEERETGLDVEYAAIIRGAQGGETSGFHHPASPSPPERERSNRSHSGSDQTVRQDNASVDIQENPSAAVAGQENAEELQTRSVGRLSNGIVTGAPNGETMLTQSPETITTSSSSSNPELWSIHYSQRPPSAALALGPMAWDLLAAKLRLSDEVMDSLKKLEKIQQHGPRIQILGNIIFVYDTITLNSPLASYLIEWGSGRIIEKVQRYVNATGDTAYHTFLFPVKMGGWFYVGKMTWTVANVWSIWPTLSARSKAKLTAKLRDRCGKRVEKDEIMRMMDEGGLQQLCFELTAGSTTRAESRAFATEMGFVPGGTTEVEA
jgi:hypothetical protein